MSVDLSELDQVVALCDVQIIPEGRGFTVDDLMKRLGTGRSTAARQIDGLVAKGAIHPIGKRTGAGAAVVYEIVK